MPDLTTKRYIMFNAEEWQQVETAFKETLGERPLTPQHLKALILKIAAGEIVCVKPD